jgi:uncharacterized protein YdcH (DUF465 family)
VRLELDRDFEREGFDASVLAQNGLRVAFSERLGAGSFLIAVLVGGGWKVFDAATDHATSKALDKLLEFTRSREKKLKLECEARDVDPRIKTLLGSITTGSREELDRALQALPLLKDEATRIMAKAEDPISELYFVWQEDHWQFTYYLSVGGDIVESV